MNNPTMRTIVGAPVTTALDAQTTALIVIDFQMEYFSGKLLIPDGLKAMAKANRLIAFADTHRMPVIHVQHLDQAGGSLFAKDGPYVDFHPDIRPAAHHVVVQKSRASSFVGTDLHQQLQARGIKTLIICGLMTHNCISSTVRDARPLNYQAIVAGDACATRDIVAWDGGILAHADLHRAALTGVSDGFAEAFTTNRIIEIDMKG